MSRNVFPENALSLRFHVLSFPWVEAAQMFSIVSTILSTFHAQFALLTDEDPILLHQLETHVYTCYNYFFAHLICNTQMNLSEKFSNRTWNRYRNRLRNRTQNRTYV
jgi:hypothetical protein